MKVVLKTAQGKRAYCKLSFEIVRHCDFLVLSRRNVQRFDHPAGGSIRVSAAFHLLPEFKPIGIGKQVLLPLAVQKSSRLAP
jgi:hypothetical protein